MRMLRRSGSILPLCFLAALGGCASGDEPGLVGDYVGQPLPGDTAELFAPGLVTTGVYTRDVAMMPDGSVLCNDDAVIGDNLNPLVQISDPASGQYNVYVGRVQPDEPVTGELIVIESDTSGPADLDPATND